MCTAVWRKVVQKTVRISACDKSIKGTVGNCKFKLSLTPALIVLICYKSVLSEMLKRSLLMHILNPLLKDLKFLYIIIYSLHLGILNLSIPVIITYFLPLLAIFFFFTHGSAS